MITRLTDTWRVVPGVVVMATILSGRGGAVEHGPQRALEGRVGVGAWPLVIRSSTRSQPSYNTLPCEIVNVFIPSQPLI